MQIAIADAKARFADLIRRAESGEQIILTRHGKPVARLTATARAPDLPLIGALKGRIRIADDFDDLPPDIAASLSAPVDPE
ncbi:MAG: type II toxin-antitoxin system prevent-host-death family antitoxin [Tabrizicola sp.]|jgi:prevent-host-death family protein|nr:type II toxin-antitoxin system prevent-host-death family antitoxin [Tabrizicola sp.]